MTGTDRDCSRKPLDVVGNLGSSGYMTVEIDKPSSQSRVTDFQGQAAGGRVMDERTARQMQGIAYVFSQSVCALTEMEGMKALNAERRDKGLAQAYGDEAFQEVINKYGIHHNAVLGTFEQYS